MDRDFDNTGSQDFKFGVTGMLLMVVIAITLAIIS
jgi:hypothetical protein